MINPKFKIVLGFILIIASLFGLLIRNQTGWPLQIRTLLYHLQDKDHPLDDSLIPGTQNSDGISKYEDIIEINNDETINYIGETNILNKKLSWRLLQQFEEKKIVTEHRTFGTNPNDNETEKNGTKGTNAYNIWNNVNEDQGRQDENTHFHEDENNGTKNDNYSNHHDRNEDTDKDIPIEYDGIVLQPDIAGLCSSNNSSFSEEACSKFCPPDISVLMFNLSSGESYCAFCDPSCGTCEYKPTHCTSCLSEAPYLTANFSCLPSCPVDEPCVRKEMIDVVDPDDNVKRSPKHVMDTLRNYNHAGGNLASVGLTATQMLNHGSSSTASAILLINLIQYIKYLNINFPLELVTMFNTQLDSIISFDFMPPFPFSNLVNQYIAPTRFSTYGVSGLFLVNFWEETITAITLIFCGILINYLSKKAFKNILISKFFLWVRDFLIWNFMITFLLSNLDEVVLYALVEFQILKLDSWLAIISFILNLFFLIVYISLEVYIIVKLYRINKKGTYKNSEEKVRMNPQVKVLFEDAKTESFIQEILVFITTIKVILSSIIIGAFDAPVVQVVLLLVLNILMLIYLAICRPLKSRWKNIQLGIYGILILMGDAGCLKLALEEPATQYGDSIAEDLIIILNFILISFVLLSQIVELGIYSKNVIKSFLAKRKSAKIVPITNLDLNKCEHPQESLRKDKDNQKSPLNVEENSSKNTSSGQHKIETCSSDETINNSKEDLDEQKIIEPEPNTGAQIEIEASSKEELNKVCRFSRQDTMTNLLTSSNPTRIISETQNKTDSLNQENSENKTRDCNSTITITISSKN